MSKLFILFFINGLVCFHWQQSLCKIETKRFVPDITLNLMLNMFACFKNTALKNQNKSIKGAIWVILYIFNLLDGCKYKIIIIRQLYSKDELFKYENQILARNINLKYSVFRGTFCNELNIHNELFNKLYKYQNTDLVTYQKTHFKICLPPRDNLTSVGGRVTIITEHKSGRNVFVVVTCNLSRDLTKR